MSSRAFRAIALWLLLASVGLFAADVPRPSPEFAINLPAGGQVLLSNYRGKAVALIFILTTCPHCQDTTVLLTRLQKEYGPRGFQVLGSAFNEMAGMLVPDFVTRYQTGFPLGYNNRESVMEYLKISPMVRTYVPQLVFVDRKGVIRAQYGGDDDFFKPEVQEKNMRTMIETLLKESTAARAGARAGTSAGAKK